MTSEYTSKCMYLHIDICNCVYRKSRWLNKMGGGEIHKVSECFRWRLMEKGKQIHIGHTERMTIPSQMVKGKRAA